jgi:cell division transport system permease protein
MTKFLRIVKFAWQNLGRNLWLTIMTVIVLSVTLFSVDILISLNVVTGAVAKSLANRIDVSVYVKAGVTDDETNSLRSYLVSLPQVADVKTVSPADALAAFRARHADEPDVLKALDEVGDNPLGATLIVTAKSLDQYTAIIAALNHPAYSGLIDRTENDFEDYSTLISKVQDIRDRASGFGIALLIVFAFMAMVIMVNVVRVAIFTHKEEIGIMKLVGAGSSFIRGPYMIESVILSFLSLVIASAGLAAAVYFGSPYLVSFLGTDPGLITFFVDNAALVAVSEFAALVVLTGAASSYAVGRYMKV